MKNNQENLIDKVISEIKKKYSNLTVDYYYDKDDDFYVIWHNNHLLDSDDDFAIYVSPLISYLHDNNFSNFCIGYDHEQTLLIQKKPIYEPIDEKISYKRESFKYSNSLAIAA